MKTITLAKAFRVRNKLKEHLCGLNSEWMSIPKTWRPGYEPKIKRPVKEVLTEMFLVYHVLDELNRAINLANQAEAQNINLRLNTINDVIRHMSNVVSSYKNISDYEVERNMTTGEQSRHKVEIAHKDWDIEQNMIKQFNKEKFELETRLSEVNGSTMVNLDVDVMHYGQKSLGSHLEDILDMKF